MSDESKHVRGTYVELFMQHQPKNTEKVLWKYGWHAKFVLHNWLYCFIGQEPIFCKQLLTIAGSTWEAMSRF